ncbi:inner membrane protein [Salinimicrobium catena]|uniref:Inner membrane protein n=1 Tax=Salinimicrobium catena TaxID=390640 RepID=A0A1H5JRL0_9FLAO|nr:metal-dependent hydrolase [Salinimicrobium catena]SDK89701.1 inner membrane protein [Salinimicrobium catena]SEE55142.1 inner membrane protein [Salinimicrobium catena]
MDSLTQIVLGAAVGEAVLGRKVGNKAMLYGAIAGTIPDLDAFAGNFTDTITAIEIHRGFSHSIIFSVLAAPVFGYLISKIERKSGVGWKDWSWLMFWGLFTHPVLDSFTTWGTQLFWPLDIRLAFKNIFVIDPLYTIPFLVFLILAMRRKRTDPKRKKYNKLGLLISSGYLVLTLIFKGIAYNNFKHSLERQGIFYERMDTRPTPFNTILWTANVEAEDAYLIGYYSFFDNDGLIRFKAVPKNHHYLGMHKNDKNVQRLIKISKGWYTISETDGDLYFNDLRFGKLNPSDPDSDFVFSYKLVPENGTFTAEEVEKVPDEGREIVIDLWERIKGN